LGPLSDTRSPEVVDTQLSASKSLLRSQSHTFLDSEEG
jgi:hypothetical protein